MTSTDCNFDDLFEVVVTTTGQVSIKNKQVNEIMHNPVGPWIEARKLYVEPANLIERFSNFKQIEYVIYDIGLGAAANSLAVIDYLKSIKDRPQVKIISFEKDLRLLQFTIAKAKHFEHVSRYEDLLKKLLLDKHVELNDEKIFWSLYEDDFTKMNIQNISPAHTIFFDPYSPKVNQEMWSANSFEKIFKNCCQEDGSLLMTYSQATWVRAAMIAAGFYVGYGPQTGLKEETTQASNKLSLLKKPLDEKWFQRWNRSHMRYPPGLPESEKSFFDMRVIKQFNL